MNTQPLYDYLALLEENKRLNGIIVASDSLIEAQVKKIQRLEATINELLRMQQQSNAFDPSERVIVPTALPGTPVRGIVRRAGSGD